MVRKRNGQLLNKLKKQRAILTKMKKQRDAVIAQNMEVRKLKQEVRALKTEVSKDVASVVRRLAKDPKTREGARKLAKKVGIYAKKFDRLIRKIPTKPLKLEKIL